MGQMRKKLIIIVLAGLAVLMAGCGSSSGGQGGESRGIEVAMTERSDSEYVFEPKAITVNPGEPISFLLRNEGAEEHEFEGETVGLEEVVVPPGKERAVAWTAPRKPGTYEIVCDLPGHKAKGMVLTVEVN